MQYRKEVSSRCLRRQRPGSGARGAGERKDKGSTPPTCVILLNYELPKCTDYLWRQAATRVCADGGASRLEALAMDDCPPPHFIVGDLDSISEDTRSRYEAKGSKVCDLSHDQDTTDLDKCLRVLEDSGALSPERDTVLILGAFGGLWDREMSNFHVALKHATAGINSVLVGDHSIAHVLLPGWNRIELDREVEGPGCALIPLGGECRVTTQGLKWNLDGQPLAFGRLVSTSNVAQGDQVLVETDKPLIWTVDSNI